MLHLEHRQQQTLTPRLQQAVRLLQLSTLDFAQELQQALSLNPFLEIEENFEEESFTEALEEAPPAVEADTAVDELIKTVDYQEPDWLQEGEAWGQGQKNFAEHETAHDALEWAHSPETLREHLQRQLRLAEAAPREKLIAQLIIEALDDDGYLRIELEELQALVAGDQTIATSEMQSALQLVQSFEPAGVACRSVRECIALQLQRLAHDAVNELALQIAQQHFDLLVQHDFYALAIALKRSVQDIERACHRIRQLDPRPCSSFDQQATAYLIPDVIVQKKGSTWVASLNASAVPKVRLNQICTELFQQHRQSQHPELNSHLQEARWTLRNLEQRFQTILRVAQAIVQRQQNFFEYGVLAMQALGLRDIAEELSLHESTISRATHQKYMATPAGIFELKYFFSRSLITDQGSTCSTLAIRGAIKEMIHTENRAVPLSDAEITRRLTQQGLQVARRTVTKYRNGMNIPPVEIRRQQISSFAS